MLWKLPSEEFAGKRRNLDSRIDSNEEFTVNAGLYRHKQRFYIWLFAAAAVTMIAFSIGLLLVAADELATGLFFFGFGVLFVFIGLSFSDLTILDEGEKLAIRFGPLPLMGTRIPYSTIRKVEPYRIPFCGRLRTRSRNWILWGNDCVLVSQEKRVFCLGTDDAVKLTQFLERKIGTVNCS